MAKQSKPTPNEEDKGFSSKDYNHVAMGAKLRLISLAKASFNVNAECLPEQENWKLLYDWNEMGCVFDEERRVVSALFHYEIIARSGRKTAVKATAKYVVLYEVPETSEANAAKGFCHNVGLFAAYPYFRALAAQLMASANINLPPLPSIASTAHIPRKIPEAEKVTAE